MIEFNLGLLADNAHVDASGKLYILGEFRYIFASAVPAQHGRLSVVARWEADIAEVRGKENTLELEIVDQDGNPVMPRSPKLPMRFAAVGMASRGKAQAQMVLNMEGIILPKYGDQTIHFIVNGQHNGKVTFHVATPPKRPTPTPPVGPPGQTPPTDPSVGS